MIFLLEKSPNQPLRKVEPNLIKFVKGYNEVIRQTGIINEYIYINNLKTKLYKYVYDGRRI